MSSLTSATHTTSSPIKSPCTTLHVTRKSHQTSPFTQASHNSHRIGFFLITWTSRQPTSLSQTKSLSNGSTHTSSRVDRVITHAHSSLTRFIRHDTLNDSFVTDYIVSLGSKRISQITVSTRWAKRNVSRRKMRFLLVSVKWEPIWYSGRLRDFPKDFSDSS